MFSGVPSYGSELSGFTGSVRQEKFIHFPNLWICDIPLAHGKFSFGSLIKIEGYWNFKWEKLVTQIRAHLELGLFLLWTYCLFINDLKLEFLFLFIGIFQCCKYKLSRQTTNSILMGFFNYALGMHTIQSSTTAQYKLYVNVMLNYLSLTFWWIPIFFHQKLSSAYLLHNFDA